MRKVLGLNYVYFELVIVNTCMNTYQWDHFNQFSVIHGWLPTLARTGPKKGKARARHSEDEENEVNFCLLSNTF